MTRRPVVLKADDLVGDATRAMRVHDIGSVMVADDGAITGIVTDRDIVVRGAALGRNLHDTPLGDLCSREPALVGPDEDAWTALARMRRHSVRRLPVMLEGTLVGIVSLADIVLRVEPNSVLARIRSTPANR